MSQHDHQLPPPRHLTPYLKAFFPGLLSVALFGVAVFWIILPLTEHAVMEKKHLACREMTKLVWDLLSTYHQQELTGALTRAEAQTRAKERVRAIRYGAMDKNYFWIVDLEVVTVMHPYRPDHEGQSQADLADAKGRRFVAQAVELAREKGEGLVTYDWQWMDDPNRVLPKQSFVRLFAPWGWVIGTGLYLDDVGSDLDRLTAVATLVGAAVFLCVTLLAGYIAWRQYRSDREKEIAQAATLEARAQYRRIVEAANEGILTVDASFHIVFVNRKMAEIVGYEPGEMLGRPYAQFMHPEERPELDAIMERRRQGQTETYERRLRHKDGRDIWAMVNATPVMDAQGRFAGSFAMYTDITERRQAQEELARRENMTQEILESLPGMFYAISDEGRFLRYNRNFELVTQYTAREIAELNPLDLFRGADKERIAQGIEEVFSQGYASVEAELAAKDGTATPYYFTGKRVEFDGRPLLIGMGIDISERRKAELAIKDSEAKYRALIETTGTGFVILDQEGRVLDANREYARLTGRASPDELKGRSVVEWTHPEDRERNRTEVEKCLALGFVRNLEIRYLTPSGEVLPVEINATVQRDRGRTVIVSLCRDISERQRVSEQHRLNADRMEALLALNGMRDAPQDQLAAFAMEEAVRLTGSKLGYIAFASEDESVLTMHAWSSAAMAECAIVDKPIVYRVDETGLWGEAVRQRRPVITNDYQADNPLKRGHPAGHVRVLRHMNVPVFDGDRIVIVAGVGNKEQEYDESDVRQLTLLMQGIWRIVRHRRAEDSLKESERRYRELFDSISDLICTHDLDGRLLSLNQTACQAAGQPAERLIGCNLKDFVSPAYQEAFERDYLSLVREKGRAEGVAKFETEGVARYLEYRNRLVREPGKEPFVIGSARDVTDRVRAEREMRRLEEQLLQAQKIEAVGVLAGGIAHDFNNVLQAISGYTQLILAEGETGPVNRERLESIGRSIERAAGMIKQLMTLARKVEIRRERVDLNQEVAQTVKILEHTLPRMINIRTRLEPGLPPICGDPGQMEQVLLNLATNAGHAMPQGGELIIATAAVSLTPEDCKALPGLEPGPYVRLQVSDTGLGMDEETLPHIFEPFFTTKRVGQGTGLGLSTVYGIIDGHGGRISCQSAPQKGTTFTIHLPAGREETPAAPERAGAPQRDLSGRETILVVDDETGILEACAEAFQGMGYRPLTAESGEEALKIVDQDDPPVDLVILDLNMPGMGGMKCLETMVARRPQTRILVATGYAQRGLEDKILAMGGVGLIGKPYRFTDLLALARQVLDKAESR